MAVGIQNGFAAFHQYTNSTTGGTVSLDWSVYGATAISINTVYMIAVTVDRTTSTNNIKIYLNGKLDSTSSNTLGAAASDSFLVGGPLVDAFAGARCWPGSIYSVMHYNRILTADEILQNFTALRGRYGI